MNQVLRFPELCTDFYVAKCNLGKVNLVSMRPVVFPTNMHPGWPGLPCHVLTNQPYLPSAIALLSQQFFYIVLLANLLPCPSHPCWKSDPGRHCVR